MEHLELLRREATATKLIGPYAAAAADVGDVMTAWGVPAALDRRAKSPCSSVASTDPARPTRPCTRDRRRRRRHSAGLLSPVIAEQRGKQKDTRGFKAHRFITRNALPPKVRESIKVPCQRVSKRQGVSRVWQVIEEPQDKGVVGAMSLWSLRCYTVEALCSGNRTRIISGAWRSDVKELGLKRDCSGCAVPTYPCGDRSSIGDIPIE